MGKQPLKESETVELKKGLAELKQGLISMAAILNKHQTGTFRWPYSKTAWKSATPVHYTAT